MQFFSVILATGLFALSTTAIVTITVESTITVCPCTSAADIFTTPASSYAITSSGSPVAVKSSTPSTTSTTSSPGAVCTDPSTLGADCSATQQCCLPYSCDSTTLTCINPDEPTDSSPASSPAAPAPSDTSSASDPSCTDPSTLGADCSATQQCCLPYTCDVSSFTCVSQD